MATNGSNNNGTKDVLQVRPLALGGYEFPHAVSCIRKLEEERQNRVQMFQGEKGRGVLNVMEFLNSPTVDILQKNFKTPPNPTLLEVPQEEMEEEKRKPLKIVKGKRLAGGVAQLLSTQGRKYLELSNGKQVQVADCVTAGKIVLICCFLVPLPANSPAADICTALIAAYTQLIQEHGTEFEMVMVAKMRAGFEHDEQAFRHFFSAFPCPAVPFEDWRSRDFICSTLGLTNPDQAMASLIVSKNQSIVQTDCNFIRYYGATSFNFSAARLSALEKADHVLRMKLDNAHNIPKLSDAVHLPLDELLDLDSASVLLNTSGEQASLANLGKSKCVAVYLCTDGRFMEELNQVQQQCLADKLGFEVVLVCTPFTHSDHIPLFVEDVMKTLKKHNISWWYLPSLYDDIISRTLWRLCSNAHDEVIMLVAGEDFVFGDLMGKQVMRTFGGISAYPFTRRNIIENKLQQLKSLTLSSVLWGSEEHGYLLRRKQSPPAVPVAEVIQNKMILLYLDYPVYEDATCDKLYSLVFQCYPRIKKDITNFEVVFVPLGKDMSSLRALERTSSMPWPMLPPARSASVTEALFFMEEEPSPCLISFDQDGKILSRCAEKSLSMTGRVDHCLFDDNLRDEIVCLVEEFLSSGDY